MSSEQIDYIQCPRCRTKVDVPQDCSESTETAGSINFTEEERAKLVDELHMFVAEHGWSLEAKTACTYSFFHMLNVIEGKWKRV